MGGCDWADSTQEDPLAGRGGEIDSSASSAFSRMGAAVHLHIINAESRVATIGHIWPRFLDSGSSRELNGDLEGHQDTRHGRCGQHAGESGTKTLLQGPWDRRRDRGWVAAFHNHADLAVLKPSKILMADNGIGCFSRTLSLFAKRYSGYLWFSKDPPSSCLLMHKTPFSLAPSKTATCNITRVTEISGRLRKRASSAAMMRRG